SEDHPQYRFTNLMRALEMESSDIAPWHDLPPPSIQRNKLISLAFRPAPVTDAWMREGPKLGDLTKATTDITLIEAASPRSEALTIALRLRQAAQDGQTAALITPDRMLTRQVSAALDRWDILPDDSAGTPLQLTPPGRFLRHVAGLFTHRLSGEMLLTLLKHPLCHSAGGRGEHLRHTRDLELVLRRKGPPFPDTVSMSAHGRNSDAPEEWIDWICTCVCGQMVEGGKSLGEWVGILRQRAESLSRGSGSAANGGLWDRKAGQTALSVITLLEQEADHGGRMNAREFSDLLGSLLATEEVRDRDAPHAGIMIWGTLEARVQGADLVILGGLNEGSWPEPAPPDPWLNRQMRLAAGLLLPERRIGLSAHDFEQAICAPEVWLTRAKRSDDADSFASRWLNRLTGLLDGLTENRGPDALTAMRSRGVDWLNRAEIIDAATPADPAPRPSPKPPAAARPRQLSVTEIKRLIRDPYAVYAKHVLRLRPLDPLVQEPDALLRGIAIHEIMEALIKASKDDAAVLSHLGFLDLSRQKLLQHVPWPTARALWLARIERISRDFLESEIQRRATDEPLDFEVAGKSRLTNLDFTLTARADRIDRGEDGRLILIDYKSGNPPTRPQQSRFDKQLLLMAAMAEQGGFEGIEPEEVSKALFVGLAGKYVEVPAPLDTEPPGAVWADLHLLIAAYLDPGQGFTARRMLHKDSDIGDYDHLARFGEWDRSTLPTRQDLT
ncbi:MAG TPA: double-strand break repair protein AddB, partial [Rhodobacteraceae bacterium]|nr:double-strand break repair protein AddB [Paracoccaceae bacterium]